MSLSPGLRASVTAALATTLVVGALSVSADVSGGGESVPYARPGSLSAELEAHDVARVTEILDPWRSGFVPALHAPQSTVVRPVPRLAAPSLDTTIDSIPLTALEAYERAASVMAGAAASCRLPWTLLAGVGRVESDHGRYAGATLGADGVSRPAIIGIALDGTGSVAAVRDTDAGVLDGDPRWDRAVGPLQFIPSTWAVVGVDADGDGRRSPHDIDDAALAAGVHLCAGTSRLDSPGNARAALLRYNHSAAYATLVMAYADRYSADALAVGQAHTLVEAGGPLAEQVRRRTDGSAGADGTPQVIRDDAHPGAGPTPTHPAAPTQAPTEPVRPGPDPGAEPAGTPSDGTPSESPAGEDPPAGAPSPPPVGEATEPPSASGDPSPGDPGAPPAPLVVEGTWSECDGGPCLEGHPLVLADAELSCQVADYDGDGSTEQLVAELEGLRDQTVAVTVLENPAGWLVLAIRGLTWPGAADDPAGTQCPAGP